MLKKKSTASPLKSTKHLGVRFRHPRLLEAALLHPSYRHENGSEGYENFDRLEFFGDTILNFVICKKLYSTFPDADEGLLSRLRSILVSKKILSRLAQKIHLGRMMKVGRSLRNQKDFSKSKMITDSLEAIFAAIYFDQGLARAEKFILKLFSGYLDMRKLFRLDPNPKSTLQELCQKHWQKLPIYTSEILPHGIKTTITIDRLRKKSALAKFRRDSEEKAARLLIRKIRQELLRRSKKSSSGKKARKTF